MDKDGNHKVTLSIGSGNTLLQIAFIVLKLCKVIDWPWIWVLAPTWIAVLLCVGFIAILMVIFLIRKCRRK